MMNDLIGRILEEDNIYLAYLRVKNDYNNAEIRLYQEFQYFELHLNEQIQKIKKRLEYISTYNKEEMNIESKKFDFILKIKSVDDGKIIYRPIAKYPLDELVLMQSVFNIIFFELKNFIPDENYGVQLNDEKCQYLYKNWTYQYKKFVSRQYQNLDSTSAYQYCYEYDIKQFYPSISQNTLIDKLLNDLSLNPNDPVAILIKYCITYYNKDNISDATQDVFTIYNTQYDDLGLPQGPLFSSFLASYYTNDMFKVIKNKIQNFYKVDCEYFTYVDDGRIFFREKVDENKIKDFITDYLSKLNNNTDKTIIINEEKSCFISLDENSAASKLKLLETQVSLLNNAVNPDFSILDDTYNVYKEKYNDILTKIENEKSNYDDNEQKKINNKIRTLNKRKASNWSKILTKGDTFEETVNCLFGFTEDKTPLYNIENFNYSYVLQNLIERIANKKQVKIFLDHVIAYLDYYENICNNTSMIYYKVILYFYLLKIDKRFLDLNTINENVQLTINSFTYGFMNFSNNLDRLEEIIEYLDTNNIIEDKCDSFTTISTKYFYKHFSQIFNNYLEDTITLDNFEKNEPNSINEILEKSKDSIIIKKTDKNQQDSTNSNKKIKNEDSILEIIYNLWKKEYQSKKYIRADYIIYDYYDFQELLWTGNENTYFNNYESAIINNNYNQLFKNFFYQYFKLDDNLLMNKDNEILPFWKYRIVSYLNTPYFNLEYFLNLIDNCIKNREYQIQNVDFNFEKVRKILMSNLNGEQSDIILQLHYYITCIWKNGAKDLPFFTLHNQEHSLELISNYQKLKSILLTDKLTLSREECFLLFVSCYLHDIGMLSSIKTNEKFDLSNKKILEYHNKINDIFEKNDKIKSSYSLDKAYQIHDITDQLFENKIRSEHAKRSQIYISNTDIFPLSDLEKKIVGKISYNHTNSNDKFYGIEDYEYYKGKKIDIRKISIWLRLLDLTDISKNRVSQEAFGNYFERMSTLSRLHWIKHLACEGISYEIEFNPKKNELISNTNVKVLINMNYLPKKEILNNQHKRGCRKFLNVSKSEKNYTLLKCSKNEDQKCHKCNLQCLFLNENRFFIEEIEYLNEYLNIMDGHLKIDFFIKVDHSVEREDFNISIGNNHTASKNIRKYYLEKE